MLKCWSVINYIYAMNEKTYLTYIFQKSMCSSTKISQKGHIFFYKKLKCFSPFFPFQAKYTQTLASHIKEVHEGEKRSHRSEDSKSDVVCNGCGKTLKKWYYQMHHKSSCSSNVVYKCDICGQVSGVFRLFLASGSLLSL